jgi:hypothetical protein
MRLQRIKRLYKVLCGPYSLGASRQRNPFSDDEHDPAHTNMPTSNKSDRQQLSK